MSTTVYAPSAIKQGTSRLPKSMFARVDTSFSKRAWEPRQATRHRNSSMSQPDVTEGAGMRIQCAKHACQEKTVFSLGMFNIVVNLNWGTLLSSTEADTYI